MEYEAQFGTVKTGDYALVVTNDYMHRRTITTVGIVQDDGYVYCFNCGIHKRKIGSEGCPVCKIDEQLIPSDMKKHLKACVKQYSNSKNQTDEPHYYAFSIVSVEKAGDTIVNITTISDRVMKKKFSTKNNMSVEDQIKETIKRRYPIDDIYWRQFNEEGNLELYYSTTREITIKEVTFDEYSKIRASKKTGGM